MPPGLVMTPEQVRHMDELAQRIAASRAARGGRRPPPGVLDVGWEYLCGGDAEKAPPRELTRLEQSEHARRALETSNDFLRGELECALSINSKLREENHQLSKALTEGIT